MEESITKFPPGFCFWQTVENLKNSYAPFKILIILNRKQWGTDGTFGKQVVVAWWVQSNWDNPLDIYGFLHQDVNSRHLGSVWNKLLSSLIRNRYLVGRSGGGSRLPCYVFFRHASVSSTYPCQSVGWSYFWISIAHEHFCATVVFDDPSPPSFCSWLICCCTWWPTWWPA